jgi:opacity protein-like surface antigen
MKKFMLLALSLFLLSSTVQAQQAKEEKKKAKMEQAERDYQATKELIESNAYSFVALQANISGGGQIFMNTRPNYIHVNAGQTDIYLPYFGRVHASNAYSPEAGIKFKGALENYELKFNDKKQSITLAFEVERGHERHEFNFNIYKGGTTTLTVASSRRNPIVYTGSITRLEQELMN